MSSGALRVRTLCVIPGVFVGRLEGLSYLQVVLTTLKRNHDKNSYYLKFSAIPLREHVKFLSRHTVFYRLYGKIKGNFLAGPSQAIVP